eukprot:5104706-Amphidinium_carterae.1
MQLMNSCTVLGLSRTSTGTSYLLWCFGSTFNESWFDKSFSEQTPLPLLELTAVQRARNCMLGEGYANKEQDGGRSTLLKPTRLSQAN